VCVKKKHVPFTVLYCIPQNNDVLEKQRKIGLKVGDVYSVFGNFYDCSFAKWV
jgi:hypothetical protein